jgi:hypothetical protein
LGKHTKGRKIWQEQLNRLPSKQAPKKGDALKTEHQISLQMAIE